MKLKLFNRKQKQEIFTEPNIDREFLKELSKLDIAYKELDLVTLSKGYEVYYDLRLDEQIKFCLIVKKMLLLGKEWDITDGSQEVVDFVKDNLSSLKRPFYTILWNILTAIDYGFSVSEKIWKRDGKFVRLSHLKTVSPWNVEFQYDDYGNLIKLKISGDEVPIGKFLIFTYLEEFGNLRGFPELASAWNAYWFKKIVQRFWARHLEKFGSPTVKGKAPIGASEEEVKKFNEILNRIHFATAIVNPRSKTGEEFDWELVESRREGGSQFYDAMEYSDTRIAKAFLIPNLFGASTIRFGSYALAEKQFEVVYKLISVIQNSLSEDINREVIQPLVLFNFKTTDIPKLVFKPYTQEEVNQLLKELSKQQKQKD